MVASLTSSDLPTDGRAPLILRLGAAVQMLARGHGGNRVGTTGAPRSAARLPAAHFRATSPAKTRRHAGPNGTYTFLGVKGSRV